LRTSKKLGSRISRSEFECNSGIIGAFEYDLAIRPLPIFYATPSSAPWERPLPAYATLYAILSYHIDVVIRSRYKPAGRPSQGRRPFLSDFLPALSHLSSPLDSTWNQLSKTRMTLSPLRNILLMNRSLLTPLPPPLGFSVHISFTFSRTILQCRSKALTRASNFRLLRQEIRT